MDWSLVLTVTFVGIFIVFGALILLSVFVFLYPKLLNRFQKRDVSKKRADFYVENVIEPGMIPDIVTNEDEDEDEIIAVIMAALASLSETSYSSNIVVKNIRRVSTKIPVWSSIGRLEQLN